MKAFLTSKNDEKAEKKEKNGKRCWIFGKT
jgi:hypothetical protein